MGLIKASQTPLKSNGFVRVCGVPQLLGMSVNVGDCLEMSVPPAARVQRLIGRPPCGLNQMSSPGAAAAPAHLPCVFYTTYVGKIRARL